MKAARVALASITLCVVALLAGPGCGRSGLELDDVPGAGGTGGGASCGDGKCKPGESCTTCPLDCGLCETCNNDACDPSESCSSCPEDCGLCDSCGNGTCDAAESCLSCSQDCGACPTCGDGYCKGAETCQSCAPDCGKCETCGDGSCSTADGESCFTCQEDCGKCAGCGDGACTGSENCASCTQDCGVCSVCGNGKCESSQFETCSNCHQDCGECELLSCFMIVTCALGCVELDEDPPNFSVSCVANCVSKGCADVQFFVDQTLSCAFQNVEKIADCADGPSSVMSCAQKFCGAELAACLGATCE